VAPIGVCCTFRDIEKREREVWVWWFGRGGWGGGGFDGISVERTVPKSMDMYCMFAQSRQSAKLFLQSSELELPHPLSRRRVCPPPP
jgi:hypothetical protein